MLHENRSYRRAEQPRVNWKVYRVDPRARAPGSSNPPPRVLEPRSRYEEVRPSSEPVVTVPTRDIVNAARERIHLRAEGVTSRVQPLVTSPKRKH